MRPLLTRFAARIQWTATAAITTAHMTCPATISRHDSPPTNLSTFDALSTTQSTINRTSCLSVSDCMDIPSIPSSTSNATNTTNTDTATKCANRSKAAAKSNHKRKGVKKSKYSLDFKLELIRYYRDRGGSYNDIRNSKTYRIYNLSKSTIADWIRKESELLAIKANKPNAGSKYKVHRGAAVKYETVDKALEKEYDRRVLLSLDVSRDWCIERASEMHLEMQLNGTIREIPWKPAAQWTPDEQLKEDRIVSNLRKQSKVALANGKITKFPGTTCKLCLFQ